MFFWSFSIKGKNQTWFCSLPYNSNRTLLRQQPHVPHFLDCLSKRRRFKPTNNFKLRWELCPPKLNNSLLSLHLHHHLTLSSVNRHVSISFITSFSWRVEFLNHNLTSINRITSSCVQPPKIQNENFMYFFLKKIIKYSPDLSFYISSPTKREIKLHHPNPRRNASQTFIRFLGFSSY